MARFVRNQPITTAEPIIPVDGGLALGRHRFQLVVVDAAGRRSTPHEAVVDVQNIVGPIEPLDPRRPVAGPVVPTRPARPQPPRGRRRRERS